MHRHLLLAISLYLLLWWLPPSTISRAESPDFAGADGRRYDTLLLGVQPDVGEQDIRDLLASHGLVMTRHWPRFHLVEARPLDPVAASTTLEPAQMAATLAALAASPYLRYADYDGEVTIADATPPNDPRLAAQWAFDAISTLAGWDVTIGNPTIAVAVLDTGVDLTHEDLPLDHIWTNSAELNGVAGFDDDGNGFVDDIRGWDWTTNDNSPQDEHGHGTHVAGVIAAATNNGIGVSGHGRNIRVAALRVLGANGSGTISDLVAGLDYAVEQGFRIVNLSLTVKFNSPALDDAVASAAGQGVIVVTAAGNQNSVVLWPAAYDEALAVAATAAGGVKASFSNFGPAIDLAAPGDSILSTYVGNSYRTLSGTSMATPHVSTLAALIWSLRPDFTRAQVIDAMITTAEDLNAAIKLGTDDFLGAGEVDFAAALAKAAGGLTLSRDRTAAAIAAHGATVPYPVRVTTPSELPVADAWVNAQVTDSAHTPIGDIRTALTGDDGLAALTITTPITAGSYLVRASVGDAVSFMPLEVLSTPITVSLTVQQASVSVAAAPVPLTVTVEAGAAISPGVSLPLVLVTNLGSFANRSNTANIDMTGLVFAGEFFPGTVAGDALIQAWVGGFPTAAAIKIEPGPAAAMTGAIAGVTPYSGGNRYLASFDLTDVYGNSAPATPVSFTGSQGTINATQAISAGGNVTTTLDLPTSAYGSVSVTATVSPSLSHTLTIALAQKIFLTQIYFEPATPSP